MGKFYTTTILLLISFQLHAQDQKVDIRLLNTKSEPVASASFRVTLLSDSSQIMEKVGDSSGYAYFNLPPGKYIINITALGFKDLRKGIAVSPEHSSFIFSTENASKTLQGVTVTASRPIMRQEDDKTIVDPENLASSSTNAYEILEKTPGLFVDQDGNIYLSSTTPALIFINGREQKQSREEVATMLKSLPPNSVASIEIMRSPSARYDASGSGGIVNVILKKGIRIGLTGSFNAGGNQGKYNNRFAGINLNNNDGSLSTYINLQVGRRKNSEQVKTDRLFAPDSLLSQDALTLYPTQYYFAGFGFSYAVTKILEISYDGRLTGNKFSNTTNNPSQIKKLSTNSILTSNTGDIRNNGTSFNTSHGVTGKLKLDSTGSEWSTDISYNYSPNNSDQLISTTFFIPSALITESDGIIGTRLNYYSGQTNLLLKFPKYIILETGIKTTHVKFTNSTEYFRQSGGVRIKDNVRTSSYDYKENINAAYLQVSKTIHGITIKAGSRMEQTIMNGRQIIPKDTSFNIRRSDLFPYIYISKTVMKIAGYDLRAYLVHRRTINRPGYQLLNPSQRYVDQYLFETGNPSLRPQFTKNYEANISVDERPLLAIGFNDTKDIFTNVIYQADTSHSISYRTYDNLGGNKETYFRFLGAIPPGKRYFFVAGGQYNHNTYNGFYESRPLLFKRGSWSFFTYQTFKLTPLTQLTLNGFVRLHGQLQFYELSAFGALNFTVNRQFLKKKLSISVFVNDIFKTNKNDFTINQGSVHASGFRKGDTQRFGLNARYSFGFRKKDENNLFNVESPEGK